MPRRDQFGFKALEVRCMAFSAPPLQREYGL